jgi:hypothetical protein
MTLGEIKQMLFERDINLGINDIKVLIHKHKTLSKVLEHAKTMTFDNKMTDWYEGNHKLSNMDEFTAVSQYFKEHKVYTKEHKSIFKSSPYYKFWEREASRCAYGYHIGRDWIPGYYYWYLNYSPIERNVIVQQDGEEITIRRYEFPNVWDGDYYFFHYVEEARRQGKHIVCLKKRGAGLSWKMASMVCRNYFIFPESRSIVGAEQERYLNKDGVLNPKAWNIMSFIDNNTAFTKNKLKNTDLHKRAGMKQIRQDGTEVEVGFKSEIIGTVLNNVHNFRGTRSMLIGFEEFGSQKDGIKAWEIVTPSVEQGSGKRKTVFGQKIAYGTGGEEGATFEAMEELIMKPDSYDILSVPELWNESNYGQRRGYFWPEYINMEGYMDKDGNTDIEGAKKDLLETRKTWSDNKTDPNTIAMRKAERPMLIEEAILRTSGNPFPLADIQERLAELSANKALYDSRSIGTISLTEDGAKWRQDLSNSLKPIEDYKPIQGSAEGAIVIYTHPHRSTRTGEVLPGRYIGGVDPIEFGKDEVGNKYSYGVTLIIDTWTESLVAEYVARPLSEDVFYENTRRLSLLYNAKLNYENNLKGIYRYFKAKGSLSLLSDEPRYLRDKLELTGSGNRKKGTTAGVKINNYAIGRITEWLVRDVKIGEDKEGNEVYDETTMQVYKIPSKGLLNELKSWNKDGNFDRISALGMAMILLDDYELKTNGIKRNQTINNYSALNKYVQF